MADAVIRGDYGNGDERHCRLGNGGRMGESRPRARSWGIATSDGKTVSDFDDVANIAMCLERLHRAYECIAMKRS
nr:hypothetical protein [Nanchangia anserum]